MMHEAHALHVSGLTIRLTALLLAGTALFGQTAGWQGVGFDEQQMGVVPEIRVTPVEPGHGDTDSNVVTLQELSHTVPAKARKEMQKAEAARARKRMDEAIDHLNKAVSIDPDFVAARNNLAVFYFYDNRIEPAVAQLLEAIKIDPWNSTLSTNLTVGYILSHKLEDAERTARLNIDLERGGGHAPMLLGLVLVTNHKYTAEALQCFRRARGDYPLAHLFAAAVLLAQAKPAEARPYLEAYLASGDEKYRSQATGWLDRIDQGRQVAVSVSFH